MRARAQSADRKNVKANSQLEHSPPYNKISNKQIGTNMCFCKGGKKVADSGRDMEHKRRSAAEQP